MALVDGEAIPFDRSTTVTISGVGLIGGSIAAALRDRGHSGRIIGVGRDPDRLQPALESGLIDEIAVNVASAARRSDLVVLCTPVSRIVKQARYIATSEVPDVLVTDAGSTKEIICNELSDLKSGPVTFIGSHPLAGSEKQGYENANPKLFEDRVCVLTPEPDTDPEQLLKLVGFWRFLGMRVHRLDASDHDSILAMTSHLPHVLASALASCLDQDTEPYAATGFRDTTRIAGGDPDLWADILMDNRPHVLSALQNVSAHIQEFRTALESIDRERLQSLLEDGKLRRNALEKRSGSSS